MIKPSITDHMNCVLFCPIDFTFQVTWFKFIVLWILPWILPWTLSTKGLVTSPPFREAPWSAAYTVFLALQIRIGIRCLLWHRSESVMSLDLVFTSNKINLFSVKWVLDAFSHQVCVCLDGHWTDMCGRCYF